MKQTTLFVGAALLVLTIVPASAQSSAQYAPYASRQAASGTAHGNGVTADGRCGGISYGTGARACDSPTGGPSGGLPSRN